MEPFNISAKNPLLGLVCLVLLIMVGCWHSDRDLSGGYRLTFVSGCEVRIWRPDKPGPHGLSVMLAGNVKQYDVYGPYITGYADDQCVDLTAEPKARPGYFLVDTKSDTIVSGMTANEWRKELERVGWSNPDLKKPRMWF